MIEHYLDGNRIPYFVCIGTTKHLIDSVAPLVGDKLIEMNISHIGDSTNNVNGKTIFDMYNNVISKLDTKLYQIIGVDAMIGHTDRKLLYKMNPLAPGSGLNKKLPAIGEMQIGLNVLYDVNIRQWYFSEEGDFYNMKDMVDREYINKLVYEFAKEIDVNYINSLKTKEKRAMRVADLKLQGFSDIEIAKAIGSKECVVTEDIEGYLKHNRKLIYEAIQCLDL